MHQLVYSFLRQGGQPCGFYPQKVEIRGNEISMWKCGKIVEISKMVDTGHFEKKRTTIQ